MDFEVVLFEVLTPKDLSRPIPSSTNVLVFCIKGDAATPPRDSVPLLEFMFRPATYLQKFHLIVQSDFELGYRVCQLERYRPKVYSSRVDLGPFWAVGLDVATAETGKTHDRRESQGSDEEVTQVLISQLEEKVRGLIITSPDLLVYVKPTSAIAQIKNLATGVLKSYQSRARLVSVQLPQPSEMAEIVYAQLSSEGVLTPQPGPKPGPKSTQTLGGPVSVHTSNLISMIKKEGLGNYVELFLRNPMQRAPREKAARNQFTNLLHGLVLAQRQRGVPNMPDEEKLSTPMFNQLKALGVITVQGATVAYNDEKISELAINLPLQESIANSDTVMDSPTPSNFRLSLLYRATQAYYTGILSSDECRGRTESAVKEQIRNNVKHTLTAAIRESTDSPASIPSVDDVTSTIFEAIIQLHAVYRTGSEMRYSPADISEVGRRLETQTLFAETEVREPAIDVGKRREILNTILAEIRGQPGLTLGKLDDVCSKRVLAALRFDPKWAASGVDARTLAVEVMRMVVTEAGHALSLPIDLTLDAVLANVPRYRDFPVNSSPGDIYSEDQDA